MGRKVHINHGRLHANGEDPIPGLSMWPGTQQLIFPMLNGYEFTGNWRVGLVGDDPWDKILENHNGSAYVNGAEAYTVARLGPKGSAWMPVAVVKIGPDAGKIRLDAQYLGDDSPGNGYDLDGQGLPYSGGPSNPYYTAETAQWEFDLYDASAQWSAWSVAPSMRLMGNDGTSATGNFTTASDGTGGGLGMVQTDGGSGMWSFGLTVIGKNASSSDYAVRIAGLWIARVESGGGQIA